MRRLVDTLALMVAAAMACGVVYMWRGQNRHDEMTKAVAADVQRFGQEVQRRAATGHGEVNGRGWPVTIEPAWFDGRPPQNPLLSSDRPWVEVATPEQAHLMHPEVRIAVDRSLAAFWYNPYQGVVRTRVPASVSDQQTLELYNRVNRCSLSSIFQPEPAPPAAPPAPIAESAPSENTEATDGVLQAGVDDSDVQDGQPGGAPPK